MSGTWAQVTDPDCGSPDAQSISRLRSAAGALLIRHLCRCLAVWFGGSVATHPMVAELLA